MANNISETSTDVLMDVLKHAGILNAGDKFLEISKAGEGNMNIVLRMKTSERTLILKQSPPFVNKYPHIPAPVERIKVEYAYYGLVQKDAFLTKFSPKIIGFLPVYHLLVMDDLGPGLDYRHLYQQRTALPEYELDLLINYLLHLHQLKVHAYPENRGMRRLNHEHIFKFPFLMDNGFDLDQIQSGLEEAAKVIRSDSRLLQAIEQLGLRYLSKGRSLIHGDFYPGSWLRTSGGIKVIDTEFSFMGDPEFDLGVLCAHLMMSNASPQTIFQLKAMYMAEKKLDLDLLDQYTGVEILRRLIGLAQLQLTLSLSEKKNLMDYARNLILHA
jgi:5-methylthioribose kinase